MSQFIGDFGVAWHRRGSSVYGIKINRMFAAIPILEILSVLNDPKQQKELKSQWVF
jgi:hypothetical protein